MMQWTSQWLLAVCPTILFVLAMSANTFAAEPARPVGLIFDTDIGNDIDDALALSVIHALGRR